MRRFPTAIYAKMEFYKMDDTDSTPEVESAGEAESIETAPEPELADVTVDTVLDAAIEEHYVPEESPGPERDDKGRFTSNKEGEDPPQENPDEAPPDEASGEGDDDQAEDDTDSEPEKADEPPLTAPEHWPDADKAKFDVMPREAQAWALDRYKSMTADYTRKTQELAQERQQRQPLEQVMAPLRESLQARGVTEADYVGRLVEADRRLQNNPVEAIQWLAQQVGVDLATLEPGEQQYADPQIAALQSRVDQLTNHLTEQERLATETRSSELGNQIESFRNKTDDAGTPLYPHFDTVRTTMGSLIQAGQAQGMEDAYAKAIRLDDALYQEAMTHERQKAEAAEEARRKDAVAKAKKVQSVKGSRPTQGTTQSSDLDSLLSSAIDSAGIA
jgi:hypothetical protein